MKNNIKNLLYFIAALIFSNSAAFAAANELKMASFKLLKGMFGVILSAVVIYVCVIAYKQFKSPYSNSIISHKEQNNLQSSQNLDDAIEHFIKDSE